MIKLREDFWASKSQHSRIWRTIRTLCETEAETAEQLLEASGLFLIEGTLRILRDNNGNIYQIPNFCINDPLYIKEYDKVEKSKEEIYQILLSDIFHNKEYKVELSSYNTGEDLALKFLDLIGKNKENIKVRMVYQGHEILYDHQLFLHKIDSQNPKVLVTYRNIDD